MTDLRQKDDLDPHTADRLGESFRLLRSEGTSWIIPNRQSRTGTGGIGRTQDTIHRFAQNSREFCREGASGIPNHWADAADRCKYLSGSELRRHLGRRRRHAITPVSLVREFATARCTIFRVQWANEDRQGG